MIIRHDLHAELRLLNLKLAAAEAAFSPSNPRVYGISNIKEPNIELYAASGDFSGSPRVFCLVAQTINEAGREGLSIGLLMGAAGQKLPDYERLAFSRANFTRGTQDSSFLRLKKVLDAVVGRATLLKSESLLHGAGPDAGEVSRFIKQLGSKVGQ